MSPFDRNYKHMPVNQDFLGKLLELHLNINKLSADFMNYENKFGQKWVNSEKAHFS